jgi:serine protease
MTALRSFVPRIPLLFLAVAAACGGGGGGSNVGPSGTATLSGTLQVPAIAPAMLARDDFDRPMREGEVVVWLEPGRQALDLAVDGFELIRSGGPIAVYRAHAAAGKSSLRYGAAPADSAEKATADAAVAMKARAGVRHAQPNFRLFASSVGAGGGPGGTGATPAPASPAPAGPSPAPVEPNDPLYPRQWHYGAVNLPQTWGITQGSSAVVVAVLDSGILGGHPDFEPSRLVDGYDMVSDLAGAADGDGRDANPEDPGDRETPQGSSFHGTHVAGTIGAASNNGFGVAGVDWNCKLMNVRVLGVASGSTEDVANGILYAAGLPNGSGQLPSQRADIINMRLGGPGLNPVLEAACDAAAAAGCLLIASAGNENSTEPASPASFASVLSVGATDLVGQRAPYSNFENTVDVWAPGGNMTMDADGDQFPDGVLSTKGDDSSTLQFDFDFLQGTSMAAPHVAGIAALVKAANPTLTASAIRSFLTSPATTQAGSNLPNGGRIVDALRAVLAAGGGISAPVLVATPGLVDFGSSTTASSISLENLGTGNPVFQSADAVPDFSWLGGDVFDVTPGNGLDVDRIDLTIDRAGLADGVYQSVITVNYLDGTTPVAIEVPLRVQVGDSTPPTDTIFVLLADPDTLEVRFQAATSNASAFDWSLANVTPGQYVLFAGTDRDNDDLIGDEGELFGAWPTLDTPTRIVVAAGGNRADLDFAATQVVEVQSTSTGPARRLSLRRLP